MKKLILAAITLTSAASVFAQGTVTFNNRLGGTSHVYAPLGPGDNTAIIGNSTGDGPLTGTTDFGGRVMIGTLGGAYTAAGTFAALLGANGAGQPESSLLPASGGGITTFRTGGASGNVAATTATFNNIPLDAAFGTFEMAVWDNRTGLYPTWAQASVAWKSGLIAAGTSGTFTLASIGGLANNPPFLFPGNGTPNPGLQSFNLYFVPEPTTAALLGLGAAGMLIFRRRKQ
jgi:hypothetical protein